MKDKVTKMISVLKREGIVGTFKKSIKYISANYGDEFSIKNKINFKKNKKKLSDQLVSILESDNYDRIVIWRSGFGWNVPLYQRPQHISTNFTKFNTLVFYEVTKVTDNVDDIKALQENLYLVNFRNKGFRKLLMKELSKVNKPKYIQFYSTDWALKLKTIKNFIKQGYRIIYEYIDDLSPALAGTKELPANIIKKYDYAMTDIENVYVVVTADNLKKDVISKRGNDNLVFSTNGVDYDFFQDIDNEFKFEKEFSELINDSKPLIGYYGALAKWFDYDLIKKIDATNRYNIVLIGIKYDDTFDKSKIEECNNVYFLGPRDYMVLKNYANKIDVLTIPFLINEITQATSPLKLFEYMALRKPIVTTGMHECRKYESVLIGEDHDNFIKKLNEAILLKNDNNYLKVLDKDALDNTWYEKAKVIVELLKENEK